MNIQCGESLKPRLAVFQHVKKEKIRKQSNFQSRYYDDESSSASESELIIDDNNVKQVNKRKRGRVKTSDESLTLFCQWNDCWSTFVDYEEFHKHILNHAPDFDELICCWDECNWSSPSIDLLTQHVSYHGHLTKLKCLGEILVTRNDLPVCNMPNKEQISTSLDGYKCEWQYCSQTFNTIYDFYLHMKVHIRNNPKSSNEKETIGCYWIGCHSKFSNIHKLEEHLRVHTKEKVIACPTCGNSFSSRTKFNDHRKKQLPVDQQQYQCSQCMKLFANERLLRDHIRAHVNHYKCSMCDMTCQKPSVLAKHIRFRHIDEKFFQCPICKKSFVENHNLQTHLLTHDNEKQFTCKQCNYKCRSVRGIKKHWMDVHKAFKQIYECHCCKKTFTRGQGLTHHLMNIHNFHWPSGHSRFRYRQDSDGIYRLQTVRYESLEVTELMIQSESEKTSHSENQTKTVQENASVLISLDDDGNPRTSNVIHG